MQRTLQQNKSLHKWFSLCSEALNAGGFGVMETLRHDVNIPWDKEGAMFKQMIWKKIQKTRLHIESTTELETKDIDQIMDIIIIHLGEKLGVELPPFPSEEEQLMESRVNNAN